MWWYHHPMTTATAQASPNIAFTKHRLAKLGRINGIVCDPGDDWCFKSEGLIL
jgi:hypothetical protein